MTLRIALYCLLGGICTAAFASPRDMPMALLVGFVLAAAFVPVARWGPRHPLGQFAAIVLALVTVGLVCTLCEAVVFKLETMAQAMHDLQGGFLEYAVLAAVLALFARVLNLTDARPTHVQCRRPPLAIAMVLLGGIAYLVYYLIFGSITYFAFTKKYSGNVPPPPAWFWGYQVARGAIMVMAVLPIIYRLRMRRWQAALVVGLILWIAGGGAGLLAPNPYMVAAQRYAHIVEIMTQNVSLGITAVLLLRRADRSISPRNA